MPEIQGKTILITGASRGIGEATARHFAAQGARVILAARTVEDIDRIAKDINAAGGRAFARACDVSQYEQVKSLVDFAMDKGGCISVLVNNAGVIDPIARLDESDPEAWGKVVDINLKGVYYATHAVLPHMLKEKHGVIVNLSSGAATSALEGWSHYCSTKAAVLSLTQCSHKEYAEHGIRVVGLSPGTVATDMQITIRRSGVNPVSQLDPGVHIPAEWVARAVEFLCGPEGAEFAGRDFSLKTDEGRRRVGLPLVCPPTPP